MEKELALAFDFDSAPDEVKKTAEEHRKNFLRLRKAQGQVDLWSAELDDARKAHSTTQRPFQDAVQKWTQETELTEFPVVNKEAIEAAAADKNL